MQGLEVIGKFLGSPLVEQIQIETDVGQGGAQLVRDIGDEAGLELIGGLRLGQGLLQFGRPRGNGLLEFGRVLAQALL